MKERIGNTFLKPFLPLDLAAFFYILFSSVYIICGASKLQNVLPHLIGRIAIIVAIIILALLSKGGKGSKTVLFLRNLYPLIFVSFFYSETYYLKNIIFPHDLDVYIYNAEQSLWNCQPSLEFSKIMDQKWFNELMNICYFSYYFIIMVACIIFYFKNTTQSYKNLFIVFFSFYLYYIVFSVFPVIGPKYYIQNSDIESAPPYFFGKLMDYLLTNYEKPTGAFPSSHVGIMLIISYLSFKSVKKMFYISLPFVIGICFATVYIKAHYLVDVLAGIVSVPIFIMVSGFLYNKFLPYSASNALDIPITEV